MFNLGNLLLREITGFAADPAPPDPVLHDATGTLTYRQLADAAADIKTALESAGLRPDEPVLVPVANEARDLAALMGVWLAGGVAVPVSRHAPANAIEVVRAAAGAKFSVTNMAGERITTVAKMSPPHRAMLQGAAVIIFTSGSTGRPKGVVLGHRAFVEKLDAIDSMLGFTPRTRTLLVLQITFVFGLWVLLLTVLKGGAVWMRPRFDPPGVLAELAELRISDVALVPTMLRKLLALDPSVSAPLLANAVPARILTGGEPFGRALSTQLRDFMPGSHVVDIYGLTETCSSDFFLTAQERERLAGTIGRPGPRVQFRIVDEAGRELPTDTVGELQIQTPFIMNGYLDEPEITRAAFAGGYFRTGDLARTRQDGSVELAGRMKELIMRGGAKISPLELDLVLVQHPAIAAALATGVPDPIMGERIHVLVVPRANARIDEKDLRAWIAARIERFKWPDIYHFAPELPTGRTGKVDRNALRAQVQRGEADATG